MTGILILARLGSKRLLGKHLLRAADRTFIEWLILRIQRKFSGKPVSIVICTADEPINREFAQLEGDGISVYYGNKANLPVRLYDCAMTYGFDNILMVDGDDILLSMDGLMACYEKLEKGAVLVRTDGLPFGMNSSGIAVAELRDVAEMLRTHETVETGWGRFFNKDKYELIGTGSNLDEQNQLRFTLDYEEDRLFFTNVIVHFGEGILEADDASIVKYVKDKQVYQLNYAIHKQYWDNFYAEMKKENV